jgi:pimeloyl-ACP methyl ester carboxylesterase
MTKEHEEQQADLADLSEDSRHLVVPDSGHHIQLDQPDVVISAIAGLLEGGIHAKLH